MTRDNADIKNSWARDAAVKLARKLYGRRIEDSARVIRALLEMEETGSGAAMLTFKELLQKTGLSEWRLRRAIDFLILTEVVGRKQRIMYCLVVKPPEDLELFLAARAAFRLAGDD